MYRRDFAKQLGALLLTGGMIGELAATSQRVEQAAQSIQYAPRHALLLVVGLTGSMLAYKHNIDRILNPQFFAKPQPGAKRLAYGDLAMLAEQIDPRIQVWYFSDETPDSVSIRCVPRKNHATGKAYDVDFDHLILDPYSGQELGRRSEFNISRLTRQNFMPFMYKLHTSLAAGDTGWAVLGYVALVWTIDCCIGFYLTLPLGFGSFLKRWKYAWWVKVSASSFRVNFDLHRANGLWLWPLLFIFAWSGVMFNLSSVYTKVTCATFGCKSMDDDFLESFKGHETERPKLDWRAAEARARQLMSEQAAQHGFTVLRPTGIALIGNVGVYSYSAETSLDLRHDTPDTFLFLDADTGEFVHLFNPNLTTGTWIGVFLKGAHYGDLRGWWLYRFLVFLTGLVIAVLSYTGVYIWWRKRRVRKLSVSVHRLMEAEGGRAA
ncbi:MAG: PepSY-associated TM helix domain-containing protein [Terriglobales bacterium]